MSAELAPATPGWWSGRIVTEQVLGHDCLTFVARPTHIADLLIDARRFPDREYVVRGHRRLTFAQHDAAVARTCRLLQVEHGVRPGDRVLLLGANSVAWVVGFWSILAAGGVVVLGNAWWSGDEIVHALATTKPALVLADAGRATLLPPDTDMAGFDQIEAMLDDPTPVPLPAPVVEEDAPAIVLFTSGTTGRAKGAILSHRGVLATLHALLHVTRRLPAADTDLPPPSRALLSLPLFHIGGLQQLVNPMVTGGTLVFTEGRYRPEVAENLLREERIRVWSTVPTMVSRLIAHLEATGATPLDGVRTLGLGGSPVSEELRARVRRWFPEAQRGLAVTYGLSEAGGVVTTGAGTSIRERPGTVGRPLPTTTVRIEEPNERGIGEILVRSPSVMLGYWTDGEPDSGPVRADRWLRTGDIGRLDADGYLYITDRSKDIVIRGGENIATPHVEARILQHPAVAEVAVVGLPHTELGEEVGAVVVPTPGQQVAIEELAAFVAETLAYFEVPSRWLLREEPLPKNVIGKVLKHALRAEWVARDASPDAATAVPAQ